MTNSMKYEEANMANITPVSQKFRKKLGGINVMDKIFQQGNAIKSLLS